MTAPAVNWFDTVNLNELTGLTALLILFVYSVKLFFAFIMARMNIDAPSKVEFRCPNGETHARYIEELHQMTLDTEKKKDAGHFGCVMKSRDELNAITDMQKHTAEAVSSLQVGNEKLLEAMQELAVEMKAVSTELRLTRNNKGR